MKRVMSIAGEGDEVIAYLEIEPLIDFLDKKGWHLQFKRNSYNSGWLIQFIKESKGVKPK